MRGQGLCSVAFVAVLVLSVGCAKTPATLTSSAPAPTGGTSAVKSGEAKPVSHQDGTRAGERSGAGTSTTMTTSRPSPSEFVPTAELADIQFDFDKYEIRPDAAQILDRNAGWLKTNPNALLLIEGHADERGTNEYNVALGDRRAKATMSYLVSRGVAAQRINLVSYGEERPACAEHTEACWAKNRRAHFLVKRG